LMRVSRDVPSIVFSLMGCDLGGLVGKGAEVESAANNFARNVVD